MPEYILSSIYILGPRCSGAKSLQRLFSLVETWKAKLHFNWQLRKDMSSKYMYLGFKVHVNVLFMLPTSILKTLKTRVDGGREAEQRETKPPLWLRRLKTEWRNEMVTSFLYASSCGSLDAFKYLLASQQKPDIRYIQSTL